MQTHLKIELKGPTIHANPTGPRGRLQDKARRMQGVVKGLRINHKINTRRM